MSSHVYHEIWLHFNWHTKADLPLLIGDMELLTHRELQEKCRRIKGAYLHAVGGTDTHVHLVLSIEPFVTISELVQEMKGASSFEVNNRMNRKALEWQRGYGVVSFGKRNLEWVLDYVRRQREHHAGGRLQSRLEIHDSADDPSPAERSEGKRGSMCCCVIHQLKLVAKTRRLKPTSRPEFLHAAAAAAFGMMYVTS